MTRKEREALLREASNPLGMYRCLFRAEQTEETYTDYDRLHSKARERAALEDKDFINEIHFAPR